MSGMAGVAKSGGERRLRVGMRGREGGVVKFVLAVMLAFIATLVTLAVIFLFNDSWQKAVFEQIVAEGATPTRRWQVEGVRLRPTEVSLRGVYVLEGAMGMEARTLSIRGPFWQSVLTGQLHIEGGELEGVFLDLSGIPPERTGNAEWWANLQAAAKDPAFWSSQVGRWLGYLEGQNVHLKIENVTVDGTVHLPGEVFVPIQLELEYAETGAAEARVRLLAVDAAEAAL